MSFLFYFDCNFYLRFDGFTEEWKTNYLNKLFDNRNERNNESLEVLSVTINDGVLKRSELGNDRTNKDKKSMKHVLKGDLVYNPMFMWKGASGISPYDGITSADYIVLKSKENVNSIFFSYLFQTKKSLNKFKNYSQGSLLERLRLMYPQFSDIKIVCPSYEEQQKIANFLTVVDKKIELLKNKYNSHVKFKKYLMQQIFTQKLRFDFDDEWKQVKLKDIVERVTRKNTNLETDLALTISAEYGLIDQEEFFNKIVASKSLKNYYLIKNGEFAYNKSYSNGYPYGAIKRLDDYPMGALSTLYICFKPTTISSNYLKEYFETTFWYKEIYSIAVEGARNHGLLNINVNDFFNTKHLIPPSIEEQEKIADLFKCINSKIDAVNNDLKLVKNFKKGLLQQMFV